MKFFSILKIETCGADRRRREKILTKMINFGIDFQQKNQKKIQKFCRIPEKVGYFSGSDTQKNNGSDIGYRIPKTYRISDIGYRIRIDPRQPRYNGYGQVLIVSPKEILVLFGLTNLTRSGFSC